MLTRTFLAKSARELGVDAKRITDEALARIAAFEFPGNVRQLENLCHWLTVMAPAQVVELKDLPPEILEGSALAPPAPAPAVGAAAAAEPASLPGGEPSAVAAAAVAAPVAAWLGDLRRDARRRLEAHEPEVWEHLSQQFEAGLIQTALELTRGRRIEAAQRLGIGRNTITRKIQELGLPD
jgi:two-component system nitrogen regulation response regulator GlnG